MESENKTGLYIVAIVAIIAIVVLAIMTFGEPKVITRETSNNKDTAGQAYGLYGHETIIADEGGDYKNTTNISITSGQFKCLIEESYVYAAKMIDLLTFQEDTSIYFGATGKTNYNVEEIRMSGECGYVYDNTYGYSTAGARKTSTVSLLSRIKYSEETLGCNFYMYARNRNNICFKSSEKFFNEWGYRFPNIRYGTTLIYDNTENYYYFYLKADNYKEGICNVYLTAYAQNLNGTYQLIHEKMWEFNPCIEKISMLAGKFMAINGTDNYYINVLVSGKQFTTFGYGRYIAEQFSNTITLNGREYKTIAATEAENNNIYESTIYKFITDKKSIPKGRLSELREVEEITE